MYDIVIERYFYILLNQNSTMLKDMYQKYNSKITENSNFSEQFIFSEIIKLNSLKMFHKK